MKVSFQVSKELASYKLHFTVILFTKLTPSFCLESEKNTLD